MTKETEEKRMRLVVVVTDAGPAVQYGGQTETFARIFDMPPEMQNFIKLTKHNYSSFCVAVVEGEK